MYGKIKKRFRYCFLLLCMLLALAGCGQVLDTAYEAYYASSMSEMETEEAVSAEVADTGSAYQETEPSVAPVQQQSAEEIDRDGVYTSAEDVALYLHIYRELPQNFITKKEAKALGWPGGSLEEYAPGMCIGGDYFGNYEKLLPEGEYHECDIDTLGADSRGPKRLVYSDDGYIYYTEDHYESFEMLYSGPESK